MAFLRHILLASWNRGQTDRRGNQPKLEVEACTSPWCRKAIVLTGALSLAFTSSGKTLSPVITDAL